MTRDDFTPFSDGMIQVIVNPSERIAEDGQRLLEGNTVFPNVVLSLPIVPGKLHEVSLLTQTGVPRQECGSDEVQGLVRSGVDFQ